MAVSGRLVDHPLLSHFCLYLSNFVSFYLYLKIIWILSYLNIFLSGATWGVYGYYNFFSLPFFFLIKHIYWCLCRHKVLLFWGSQRESGLQASFLMWKHRTAEQNCSALVEMFLQVYNLHWVWFSLWASCICFQSYVCCFCLMFCRWIVGIWLFEPSGLFSHLSMDTCVLPINPSIVSFR